MQRIGVAEQEGAVLVGGRDVREVTQESLGRHIAMVLQEPYLFTGTVMENIRYASHWASDEDVVAAARAVGAHDFITALPDGYGLWFIYPRESVHSFWMKDCLHPLDVAFVSGDGEVVATGVASPLAMAQLVVFSLA